MGAKEAGSGRPPVSAHQPQTNELDVTHVTVWLLMLMPLMLLLLQG